jgi:hypothetical protein
MKQFDVKNWRNKFLFENKFDLPGDQEKIDVAKPKGQITKADFDKLRAEKGMKEETDEETAARRKKWDDENNASWLKWQERHNKISPTPELEKDIKAKKDMSESGDHEVSMANNSLEAIVKAAMELKAKMGDQEKDIPAWIQDHITNAANFIRQASENYHEYGGEEQDIEGEEQQDQF